MNETGNGTGATFIPPTVLACLAWAGGPAPNLDERSGAVGMLLLREIRTGTWSITRPAVLQMLLLSNGETHTGTWRIARPAVLHTNGTVPGCREYAVAAFRHFC